MDAFRPARPYIGCRPTWRVTARRVLSWLDENSYDVVIVATLLFVVALVGGK